MPLLQSAKLNGHDLYPYLKDLLSQLPTQKNSAIDELLPHNWPDAYILSLKRPNMDATLIKKSDAKLLASDF